MIPDFHRIEFLVPAENAIGGKAYWTPFEDCSKILDPVLAGERYKLACKHNEHVRWVKVSSAIVDSNCRTDILDVSNKGQAT